MSSRPRAFTADSPLPQADDLARRWVVLHEAAAIVAALAGVPAPTAADGPDGFPTALRRSGGWRLTLGRQGIADLSAILEGGIRALLAVHASGARPQPAAQALWDEFVAARAGLLALVAATEPLHGS